MMDVGEIQGSRTAWFSRRKRLVWRATRRFRSLDSVQRVHLDDYVYPHYAYGVLVSCMQARMLGFDRVTVIEFGVAGGNGLVALESASAEIGPQVGVTVDVLGFDTGEGMPSSDDPKDVVYWFRPAAFKMDVARLQRRLTTARLVLGRIEDTVAEATRELDGPIGFCALDMDYYSATVSALSIFDADQSTRLPRVLLYADDIFGYHDLNVMSTDVGEERAIADFNESHDRIRIGSIRGLRHKRPIPAMWNDKMFALHDFDHPLYNEPINPATLDQAEAMLHLRPER